MQKYKGLLFWFLPVILSGGIFAWSSFKYSPPLAEWDRTTCDFGVVPANSRHTCLFKVKNVGGKPLVISSIQTSCSCTSATAIPAQIGPGQTGTVEVHFDVRDTFAPIFGSVFVETNSLGESIKELKLKALVEASFDVRPRIVDFGIVKESETPKRRLAILGYASKGELDISIQPWAKRSPVSAIVINEVVDQLQIQLNPGLPAGRVRSYVTLSLAGDTHSAAKVTILAHIKGKCSFNPLEVNAIVSTSDKILETIIIDERSERSPTSVVVSHELDSIVRAEIIGREVKLHIDGTQVRDPIHFGWVELMDSESECLAVVSVRIIKKKGSTTNDMRGSGSGGRKSTSDQAQQTE